MAKGKRRTRELVLAELSAVSAEIRGVGAMRARRDDLVWEARNMEPPVTYREISEAAELTELSITKIVRAKKESAA